MNTNLFRLGTAIFLALGISACALFTPRQPTPNPTPVVKPSATPLPTADINLPPGAQPVQISGDFSYSNDFVIETYFAEHMVALVDLHGFVTRDQEWLIPIESQTLGYVDINAEQNRASFWLQLPTQPAAVFNDVDRDAKAGVQIFTVAYWPNLTAGPFSEGDDPSRGWPTYLTSVKIDNENKDEITGGILVVWSPDSAQQFPTGFGADGLLFTADDPLAAIPPGYSLVNLDQQPFGIIREREPYITLYEPQDVAVKDFSGLGYTEAFNKMFEIVRREYAFNDIPGKAPDWDALYDRLVAKVTDAEKSREGLDYYKALVEFTSAFRDGHVGISGGSFDDMLFEERAGGGYGFALRELDNGDVIVVFVADNSPASKAGLRIRDRVTGFNGKPIADAIATVVPVSGTQSSDFALRFQQVTYLTRAKIGQPAEVTYTRGSEPPKTVKMTAVSEFESLQAVSLYRNYDRNALPVEYRMLASNTGYVRINSNSDDLALIVRLFQRALKTFENNGVSGLIIDMRLNFGGSPLGLAGFLTDQQIPLGQLEYFSDATGKFEPEGPRDKVYPNQEQYRFNRIILLVDQTCYSACEIEAYGFSQLPGVQVMGQYPSAGVEAEVARGQFEMPEGISLQIPTGRFRLPDGSLFLEGVGVVPDKRVPITVENVLTTDDVVLQAALDALE